MQLPDWMECDKVVMEGKATALQEFIYYQEPAGIEAQEQFRNGLIALIEEIMPNAKTPTKTQS